MDSHKNLLIKYEYFKYRIRKCIWKLPKINIVEMKERDEVGTFAYTNNSEVEEALGKGKPITLYYHRDLFTYLPRYRNAILLHEFTHISDFIKFRKYRETSMLMCTYSEFHATQIEFIKLCGLHRITIRCRKSLDSKICFQDKKATIKEYIDFLFAEVLDTLNEDLSVLDDKMKAANAVALIKHLMYFYGAVSFYEESKEELLMRYFHILSKYEYGDMFMRLYVNVTQKQYEGNFRGYMELVNKITDKYLGI